VVLANIAPGDVPVAVSEKATKQKEKNKYVKLVAMNFMSYPQ
jgi:hypothetical protein